MMDRFAERVNREVEKLAGSRNLSGPSYRSRSGTRGLVAPTQEAVDVPVDVADHALEIVVEVVELLVVDPLEGVAEARRRRSGGSLAAATPRRVGLVCEQRHAVVDRHPRSRSSQRRTPPAPARPARGSSTRWDRTSIVGDDPRAMSALVARSACPQRHRSYSGSESSISIPFQLAQKCSVGFRKRHSSGMLLLRSISLHMFGLSPRGIKLLQPVNRAILW
jgi:hypothetical protein